MTWRALRAYKTIAVASVRQRWWEAAVQAGVALLTMAVVGAGLLTSFSVPASYAVTKQQLNAPDLWVGTLSTSALALYAAVGQRSDVSALTPIYMVQSGVIRVGGKELPASISSLPDQPPPVGSLAVTAGAWPAPDANAVLLERGAAQSMGATPGSEATVVGGGGSLRLHVAGVGRDISRASYPLSAPAAVYVRAWAWRTLGGDPAAGAARFGAKVRDRSRLRAAARAIRDLGAAGVPITINDGALVVEGLSPLTFALEGFLVLFGLFGLVACLFFIVGTTRADLIRQARSLGILRATGWSLRHVRRLLMLQRGAAVLLGVILGALAAVVLAGWMTGQVVQLMGLSPALDAAPAVLASVGSQPSTWGYAYDWRVDYVKGLAAPDVQRALDSTAGIQGSVPIYDLSATLDGNRTDARFVTPNQDLLRFHLLSGRAIGSDSEVLIGAGLAASTGLAPGRSVVLQLGTDQATVQVAGVYRELDNLGQVVVGRDSLLLRIRPQATPAYFLARLQPGANAGSVRSTLEQSVGGQVVVSPVRDSIAVPLGNVFEAVLLILGFGLAAVAGVLLFAPSPILAGGDGLLV